MPAKRFSAAAESRGDGDGQIRPHRPQNGGNLRQYRHLGIFVHPGEAAHGDLGMVTPQDVVIALSNSGESNEILALIPVLKRQQVKLICITSRPESSMARAADIHLCVKVPKEACPLGLAPTSSTTAALVMGDALAVALLEARGFTAKDFALSHPGGALGRKLLLRVNDIMHTGDEIPHVGLQATLRDALLEITRKNLGMTAICDDDMNIIGIFTDGDLRRVFDTGVDMRDASIADVMTREVSASAPALWRWMR